MFRKIADILPLAAKEMEAALEQLRSSRAREGIPPEQRALQQLTRAEALFREVQVSFGGQEQSGGGGGASPNAQDLADLFELEREKLRNQYETVQRGERQQSENQSEIDAALERLRELARRQEQENERLRQQAMMRQNQQGGGGNAQTQRQLADETEQAARQLERPTQCGGPRRMLAAATRRRARRHWSSSRRRAAASSGIATHPSSSRRVTRSIELSSSPGSSAISQIE
jgi:hypothetical protein